MIGYHNDVLCFGGSTGTATFVVTDGVPPYSYLWNNGDTNSTATNLSAGMYYCTVYDANNCTYIDSILVSQPSSAIAVNINVLNDIKCFGDSVGAAEIINISGGVSPYNLQWENGIISNLASNLVGDTIFLILQMIMVVYLPILFSLIPIQRYKPHTIFQTFYVMVILLVKFKLIVII